MTATRITERIGDVDVEVWLVVAQELASGRTRATELTVVRQLLAHAGGVDAAGLVVHRDAAGKPHLDGPLQFSISHCDTLLALALALAPIGIDVEAPIDAARADRLLRRFLPARWEEVQGASAVARSAALLRAWTRAEAAIKAVGGSLLRDLRSVRDPVAPDQPDGVAVAGRRCTVHDRALAGGHRLAIAVAVG